MSAPVIGITAYVEQTRFTVWDMPATLLPSWVPMTTLLLAWLLVTPWVNCSQLIFHTALAFDFS